MSSRPEMISRGENAVPPHAGDATEAPPVAA